ncbi:threonine dehydratase biosynthetic [Vibrio ishigakensis]|uniref:Threonine dehydratase biosynthetic n=1 Tax=Vibrio ishigakensis TaxID=1481914 RepID=A0A0B8QWW3_9VIBR|nr:threonine dehydratase biosynthetic [Vibrio ishigakensis]
MSQTPPKTGAEYLRQVLRAPIYEVATVTPLQEMPRLSERLQNLVQIKREDRQPVHSFKLRGAYNMVANLTDEQKQAGVIAAPQAIMLRAWLTRVLA